MNAQTTYLHHSPPPLEGTTSSRGRRAEHLQFSHKPYYSSVRTTAAEGTDMFHYVTSAGDVEIFITCVGSSSKSICNPIRIVGIMYRSLDSIILTQKMQMIAFRS